MPDDPRGKDTPPDVPGRHALVELATRLLVEGRDPHAFGLVLAELGTTLGASRAVLAAVSPGPPGEPVRMEVRHQWLQPGSPKLNPTPSGWLAYFPRWASELAAGHVIQGTPAELPEDERRPLQADGVAAILVVPVVVGNRWYGHLSVDDIAAPRAWTPAEVELVAEVARAIGQGIGLRASESAGLRRAAAAEGAGRAVELLRRAPAWRAALPAALEALRAGTGARSAWVYELRAGPGMTAHLVGEAVAPGTKGATPKGRTIEIDPGALARFAAGETIAGGEREAWPDRPGTVATVDWFDVEAARVGASAWIIAPAVPYPGRKDGPGAAVGLDSERARDWEDGGREAVEAVAAAIVGCMREQGQDQALRRATG